MEGKEECNSNESGWTKYIDPQSGDDMSINSSVDDGDVFLNHHHHTHGYHFKGKGGNDDDDDEDDDSIASDASSGPSYHQSHHHDNVKYHHHHYQHHGNKLMSSSGGKKSSKDEMKEITKYGNKGKESTIKTNTSSNTLKQRQGIYESMEIRMWRCNDKGYSHPQNWRSKDILTLTTLSSPCNSPTIHVQVQWRSQELNPVGASGLWYMGSSIFKLKLLRFQSGSGGDQTFAISVFQFNTLELTQIIMNSKQQTTE